MKVVVASLSDIKIEPVRSALENIELVGVKTYSRVPEQPVGEETVRGAGNRGAEARRLVPDADLYIAIENGIFSENGWFVDKAVVLSVTKSGKEHIEYSKGVELPAECVEQARAIGFDTTTVGMVMAAKGIVDRHDNPHASLGDKTPRAEILRDAVLSAMAKTTGWS